MSTSQALAHALAARLTAAIGSEARTTVTAGRVRVEADLPPQLTDPAHRAVLVSLAEADSYGHSRAAGREYVWAEILQGADPCP